MKNKLITALVICMAFTMSGVFADELDQLYGVASLPSHIKYYEVDSNDKLVLNPYLQVSANNHKVILDVTKAAYNWVIDIQGNVRIGEPVAHPRGRYYKTNYYRPEDGYWQEKSYVEKYGHVSNTAGAPARISGEIVNDRKNKRWIINNKSGRYSRQINDRTPDKLIKAATLIRSQVDPGGQEWGGTVFFLDYGPEKTKTEAMRHSDVYYVNPEKKILPYLLF